MRSENKYMLLALLGVALVIAVGYGLREYNRRQQDLSGVDAEFRIEASELITAFTSNENTASAKFIDRVVCVTGRVKGIEENESEIIVVLGDSASLSSVRCHMDNPLTQEKVDLVRGGQTAIKGVVTGYQEDLMGLLGSDVEMNRCILDNTIQTP